MRERGDGRGEGGTNGEEERNRGERGGRVGRRRKVMGARRRKAGESKDPPLLHHQLLCLILFTVNSMTRRIMVLVHVHLVHLQQKILFPKSSQNPVKKKTKKKTNKDFFKGRGRGHFVLVFFFITSLSFSFSPQPMASHTGTLIFKGFSH